MERFSVFKDNNENVSICFPALLTDIKNTCPEDCAKGIILPLVSELGWPVAWHGFIYLVALLWVFLGVAIIADVFMCSIETITSKTRRIKVSSSETKEGSEEIEVKVWNDTVANLTLMALGSSAPEILLSVIEIIGNNFEAGKLGPGTIVGSAAFNLLVITAVCVFSIPSTEVRSIRSMNVFYITGFFSVFAYVWLLIILQVSSPGVIEIWEGVITLLMFPVLVILAYLADNNCFCSRKKIDDSQVELPLGFDSATKKTFHELRENENIDREKISEILKTPHLTASYVEIAQTVQEIGRRKDLSEEETAKLVAAMVTEKQSHDRGWYRIQATRKMFGGKQLTPNLTPKLTKVYDQMKEKELSDHGGNLRQSIIELSEDGERSVIEFSATSVAVLENEQKCRIGVRRYGRKDVAVTFRLETVDGSAVGGEDYIPFKRSLTFNVDQSFIEQEIEIIDDNEYEPDETFFVKLSLPDDQTALAVLGKRSINTVTIINDDEPGIFQFEHPSFVFKESVGKCFIPVSRENGADGKVTLNWATEDITAKSGEDYVGGEGTLTFEHGETSKSIELSIIDDQEDEKTENFKLTLSNPSEGAKLGHHSKTIVTIVCDDDYKGIVSRLVNMTNANINDLRVDTHSYGEQFRNAMNVNGGDLETATNFDYIMHFLTFGWKILFAIVPPPSICGGWLAFCTALLMITLVTIIVGDLAGIFGCIVTLKPGVNAITFVALGTSLPDLFASKQAAQQEKTADNSIGNVTGSNSVNVFLGLGLPWTFAAIYHAVNGGRSFVVPTEGLAFSVLLYSILATMAILIFLFRHFVYPKGELGGPMPFKIVTSVALVTMWFIYILVSAFQAYGYIADPFA